MTINEQRAIDCIEINPNTSAKNTIIWLHGLGADGNDFVPIVPELHLPPHLGFRFIFPNAPVIPVTINQGYQMRAWYDIYELSNTANIDRSGMLKSIKLIHALIATEIDNGIHPKHIFLAGFSQGAVIALMAGLSFSQPLAGIIALSGYLPLTDDVLKSSQHSLPIFIAHGTVDTTVPYALGEASFNALKQAGYSPSWHSYPIGHSVCADEVSDISHFIQSVENEGHTTRK